MDIENKILIPKAHRSIVPKVTLVFPAEGSMTARGEIAALLLSIFQKYDKEQYHE